MKPYAAVIVFLALVLSSVLTSINSYNRTKDTIVNDMNQALARTLSEKQEAWITPDTIMNYRQKLKIEAIRNESFVTYALANTPKTLAYEMDGERQQKRGFPVVCHLLFPHHLRAFRPAFCCPALAFVHCLARRLGLLVAET